MDNRNDLPLSELISRIRSDITTIIRKEIDLLKTEMTGRAKRITIDAVMLAVGAITLFLGIQALLATVIIAIAHAIPVWLSALIIGLLLAIVGGSLALAGLNRIRKTDWMPHQSMKLFKEDVAWLKDQVV